jgi:hypothetical protein
MTASLLVRRLPTKFDFLSHHSRSEFRLLSQSLVCGKVQAGNKLTVSDPASPFLLDPLHPVLFIVAVYFGSEVSVSPFRKPPPLKGRET